MSKGISVIRKKLKWSVLIVLVLFITASVSSVYAITPSNPAKVSKVTGALRPGESLPCPNNTIAAAGVACTDLGFIWDKGGGEYFLCFGDTYGVYDGYATDDQERDWRSPVLAKSSDTNLADGLTISSWITDTANHAKQLLYSAHDKSGSGDWTNIPTAGITVGSTHYLHYMNIKAWGSNCDYVTNYSKFAVSTNNGQDWTPLSWSWGGESNFGQAALVRHNGYVYMYGVNSGRTGACYLARVPEAGIANQSAWQYWDGAVWQSNESAARPIVTAQCGEMSVGYNTYFQKWIMVYRDQSFGSDTMGIALRQASSPTGPWSGARIIARDTDYPGGLYGGYIHPASLNGPTLYYTISLWDAYNVYLAKSDLNSDMLGDNMISFPGFEENTANAVSRPWALEGNGGLDINLGYAHSGGNNAWLRSSSGWNAVKQTVTVVPNTNYRLTGYVKTSDNNTNGYFGVRNPSGSVLKETRFYSLGSYTMQTVEFNSGSNTSIDVFTGMWANGGDTWVQIDDLSLNPIVSCTGFEEYTSGTVSSPWNLEGIGGIDVNLGYARSGRNNAWLGSTSGWNAVTQSIAVTPNTNYTLSGYIQTSWNNSYGYFGVRNSGGGILQETSFGSLSDYTQQSVSFNSGTNSSITIFAGMWANNGDTWIRADDITLIPN